MFWTLNCLICLWLWGGVRGQKLLPTLFDGGFNELYWVHLWWFDRLAQQYGFQHADNRILHKARDVLFKGLIWRSRLTSKNMHLGTDSALDTTSSKLNASQMLLSCCRIVQAWYCIPSQYVSIEHRRRRVNFFVKHLIQNIDGTFNTYLPAVVKLNDSCRWKFACIYWPRSLGFTWQAFLKDISPNRASMRLL